MEREWVASEATGAFSVRIMHWNVLAQNLVEGFDKTDPAVLPWEYRTILFNQEFNKEREDGSLYWDVICTAECDKHAEFFQDTSKWAGHYGAKPGSFTGGCGVFANAKKFSVVQVICEHFKEEDTGKDMSQNFVAVEFQHIETGGTFVVIGTHLKAKPPNAHIREQQTRQLVSLLDRFKGKEVILVGDMNDTPEAECMKTLYGAYDSVYKNFHGGEEPPHTTHKFRPKEGMVTRCIDYMFTQNATHKQNAAGAYTVKGFSGHYRLPTAEELPETGFPTANHPSDHLALGAEFVFDK